MRIGMSWLRSISVGSRYLAAVLEAGTNHPGELAPLVAMIQPRFGVLTGLGREHHIHALPGCQRAVPLEVSGVGREILAGPELGRVHEQRHHGHVGPGHGRADHRLLARVQRAHGGDEREGPAR